MPKSTGNFINHAPVSSTHKRKTQGNILTSGTPFVRGASLEGGALTQNGTSQSVEGGALTVVTTSKTMQGGTSLSTAYSKSLQGGAKTMSTTFPYYPGFNNIGTGTTGLGIYFFFANSVASLTSLIEVDCGASGWMALGLDASNQVHMKGAFGGASVDFTSAVVLVPGAWYWISQTFDQNNTPQTIWHLLTFTTGQVLIGNENAQSGYFHDIGPIPARLSLGVGLQSGWSNWPNAVGMYLANAIFLNEFAQINGINSPTTPWTTGVGTATYNMAQSLGAIAQLNETNNTYNMVPGPQGATIAAPGPFIA